MAYLALLVDVFTRMIRGWALSNEMSVKLIAQALNKALERRHHPQIHHSDRGGQYIADTYCQKLKTICCRISMTDRAKPWQNPYIESTIGRIKDEYIIDSEYHDVHNAYQQLGYVLDVVYNEKRPHSSLGYRTPAEFEEQYIAHRHQSDKLDVSL
jgi:transposase InsO family protein